jgi:hypothetical protein
VPVATVRTSVDRVDPYHLAKVLAMLEREQPRDEDRQGKKARSRCRAPRNPPEPYVITEGVQIGGGTPPSGPTEPESSSRVQVNVYCVTFTFSLLGKQMWVRGTIQAVRAWLLKHGFMDPNGY